MEPDVVEGDIRIDVPLHWHVSVKSKSPITKSLNLRCTISSYQQCLYHPKVVSCEARDLEFLFSNANQLAAALKAVNPFLGRLPGDVERVRFMRELLGELKDMDTPGMEEGKAVAR